MEDYLKFIFYLMNLNYFYNTSGDMLLNKVTTIRKQDILNTEHSQFFEHPVP